MKPVFFAFIMAGAVFTLSACETVNNSWNKTMNMVHGRDGKATPYAADQMTGDEIQALASGKSNYRMSKKEMMAQVSNANVLVYPLDGDPYAELPRQFPENRGMLENTNAGGYTAFDPSVVVYGVNGNAQKPAYMPDYAVPNYAEPLNRIEYESDNAITPIPNSPSVPSVDYASPYNNGQTGLRPRVPSAPQNMGNDLPVRAVPSRSTGRRSKPVLTSY